MSVETIHIKNKSGTQNIRIPEEMRIDDNKVYLKKVGNTLHIIPFHSPWQNMKDSLDLFSPDFMEVRQQPDTQKRESLE